MRSLLFVLGLFAGVFSAALGLAGLIGGLHPWLDVASQFAPIALLAGLIAAAMAFAVHGGRGRTVFAFGTVGALCSAALMAPEWLRSTGPVAPPNAPGQIKIIEFNVWRDNHHLAPLVDWLVAQQPDIVILVESTPELRDMIVARTDWRGLEDFSSTMIVTPRPFVRVNRPWIMRDVRLNFVNATYADADGGFEIIGTHLGWPRHRQMPQREALLKVVTQFPSDRTILAGDFNSTPWSAARRRDDKAFGLIRRDRALWSWPAHIGGFHAPLPFLPIDHVYAGPGWATVSVARGPSLGSDHYPLIVTLAPVSPPLANPGGRYPGNPGH